MFNAKCVEVFIASPDDVQAERQIVREVISQINTIKARFSHTVLLPFGWEDAIPDVKPSPQDIINKQLLEDADLLIGIFYSKIGSKTERAISGTVDEIQTHIESGKPTMIYFSKKPLSQNHDTIQFDELKKFKEWIKPIGLYGTYKDEEEFRSKLFKSLLSFVENDTRGFIYKSPSQNHHIFLSSMENKNKLYTGVTVGWYTSTCEYLHDNLMFNKKDNKSITESMKTTIEENQNILQMVLETEELFLDYNEEFETLIEKIAVHFRFKDVLKYNAFLLGTVGIVAFAVFNLDSDSAQVFKDIMNGQMELIFPEIIDDKKKFFAMLEKNHSFNTPDEYYKLLLRYFGGEI